MCQSICSFLLRVFLRKNGEECDQEAVTAASLEDQPCQILQLFTDNDSASATNIMKQRGFDSRTGYEKILDLER